MGTGYYRAGGTPTVPALWLQGDATRREFGVRGGLLVRMEGDWAMEAG